MKTTTKLISNNNITPTIELFDKLADIVMDYFDFDWEWQDGQPVLTDMPQIFTSGLVQHGVEDSLVKLIIREND